MSRYCFAIRTSVLCLLLSLPYVHAEAYRVFGYFSPAVFGILATLVVCITLATAFTCWKDFHGISAAGRQNVEDRPPAIVHKGRKAKDKGAPVETVVLTKGDVEDSTSADFGPLIPLEELQSEPTQLSRRTVEPSSHVDEHEKQARIIEAIYQASGRDLPAQYSVGRSIFLCKTQDSAPNSRIASAKTQLDVINETAEPPTGVSPMTSLHSAGVLARSTTPSPHHADLGDGALKPAEESVSNTTSQASATVEKAKDQSSLKTVREPSERKSNACEVAPVAPPNVDEPRAEVDGEVKVTHVPPIDATPTDNQSQKKSIVEVAGSQTPTPTTSKMETIKTGATVSLKESKPKGNVEEPAGCPTDKKGEEDKKAD